jgi:hypothetical protein
MPSIGIYTITKNDTLDRLNTILRRGNGTPIPLADYTVKWFMETASGTSEVAETATGLTAEPTQVFTVNTSTDLLTCNDHGLEEGDQIEVTSAGTLPTGLAADTRYWAVQVTPNSFGLAATPQGPQIDITGAGTGAHTFYVVGSVQIAIAAANADTAGIYRLWITRTSGSDKWTHPEGNRWYEVRIVEAGN